MVLMMVIWVITKITVMMARGSLRTVYDVRPFLTAPTAPTSLPRWVCMCVCVCARSCVFAFVRSCMCVCVKPDQKKSAGFQPVNFEVRGELPVL